MKKLQSEGSIVRSFTAGQLPAGSYRAFFNGDFSGFATLPAAYQIGSTDTKKEIKKEQLNTDFDGWNYSVDEDRTFWKDDFAANTIANYKGMAVGGGVTYWSISGGAAKFPTTSVLTEILQQGNYGSGLYKATFQLSDLPTLEAGKSMTWGISFAGDIGGQMTNYNARIYHNGTSGSYAIALTKNKSGQFMTGATSRTLVGFDPRIPHEIAVDYNATTRLCIMYLDGVEKDRTTETVTLLGSGAIGIIAANVFTNAPQIMCTELTYIPTVSYSDSMATDTISRYNIITGTSAFNTNKVVMTAPATAWNKTKLRSYRFEAGRMKMKFTLPTTGTAGDIVANFFNCSSDGTVNFGVGLQRQAGNEWLIVELKDNAVVATGAAGIVAIADGNTVYLEGEVSLTQGSAWLYAWNSTSIKAPGGALKQTGTYKYNFVCAGYYNAGAASNTIGFSAIDVRARSLIGYTNVPSGATFKPMLRGAGVGSYWNGTTEIASARFIEDFNANTSTEWANATSGMFDLSNGKLVVSDQYVGYWTKHKFGAGLYEVEFTPYCRYFTCPLAFGSQAQTAVSAYAGTTVKYAIFLGQGGNSINLGRSDGTVILANLNAICYEGVRQKIRVLWDGVSNIKVWHSVATAEYAASPIIDYTDATPLTAPGYVGFYNGNKTSDPGDLHIHSVKINALPENTNARFLGGVSHGSRFMNDGSVTKEFIGFKFVNHDRSSVYTNTFAIGTGAIIDGTGIYYETVLANLTDDTVISPTTAKIVALPIGAGGTNTVADITLDGSHSSNLIACYVQQKSDEAPMLQLTKQTLVINTRIDTTPENYYWADFVVGTGAVDVGVWEAGIGINYFKLDYMLVIPLGELDKLAKRTLINLNESDIYVNDTK